MTMAARRGGAVPAFQALWDAGTVAGLGEAELLARFASRRDEAAFAALVRRHGPRVLGVCRRVLGDEHAAEDAFQATFLVLARKAGSIASPEGLGSWLHGVALRTAKKARAGAARRREKEAEAGAATLRVPSPGPSTDDLRPVIDEELARLPEKYRAPVLLCDLEGSSIDEAAASLGLPRGTVGTRLTRARSLLRSRLTRRGLALGGGLVASLATAGNVPAAMIDEAARSATLFADAGSTSRLATSSALLARRVLRGMTMTRYALPAALIAAVSLGGIALFAIKAEAKRSPGASAPIDDPKPRADRPRGAWVVTKVTINGAEEPIVQEVKGSVMSFAADVLVMKMKGGLEMEYTATFDPSKTPPSLRFESAKPAKGRNMNGIYEMKDGSLRLAWFENGGDQVPTDFETKPDPPAGLIVLTLTPQDKAPKPDPAAEKAEEVTIARAEANRNLRMIALAMHTYHSTNDHFPPAATHSADGKPLLSWRVAILPYIAEQELYDQFRQDEPWDSPHNKALLAKMPPVFAQRGKPKDATSTIYQAITGAGTMFDGPDGTAIEKITDGTTNTIMVVQGGTPVPWTKPEDIEYLPGKPLPKIAGPLPGGFLAVMGSGQVQFVSKKAKEALIRAAFTRNGGEFLDIKDLDPIDE